MACQGMEAVIELRDLGKTYGDFRAVRNLDLSVTKGEIFALLGPNGAGKTTTIRMMMGILQATAGNASMRKLNPMGVVQKQSSLGPLFGGREVMAASAGIRAAGWRNCEVEIPIPSAVHTRAFHSRNRAANQRKVAGVLSREV